MTLCGSIITFLTGPLNVACFDKSFLLFKEKGINEWESVLSFNVTWYELCHSQHRHVMQWQPIHI